MWNLVDALTPVSATRRKFYPPLASTPPSQANPPMIVPNLFSISESRIDSGTNTTDFALHTVITPPTGGFTSGILSPDPHIRLHAMGDAIVRFKPKDSNGENRLELQLLDLPFASRNANSPGWWERWLEADCVPHIVIYENVRLQTLEAILNTLTVEPSTPVEGLRFPELLTEAERVAFISSFLSGDPSKALFAEAGAVLGEADVIASGSDILQLTRQLSLHVLYANHTTNAPHPMNPRELFHLLFGDDSAEATVHPFLVRLNDIGLGDTSEPRTTRKVLRPPLRTWKRMVWEADQEIANSASNWRPAGSLGSDRFFNNHSRNGRTFNDTNYTGFNKCNLFTSDIAIRAGFRSCVHRVNINGAQKWHYMDANSHTNHVHRTSSPTNEAFQSLQGVADDSAVVWARKIENWLRSMTLADRITALNNAMQQEGRCYILAGARNRKFVKRKLTNTVRGIADCNASLRRNGIGHIVLVKEITSTPQVTTNPGEGLQSISVNSLQASGSGAKEVNYTASLGGATGTAAGGTGFIRIHLYELHPGKDPDTLQGLRNLNIHNSHPNLLGQTNERAARTRLTHNPDGTVRNDNICCQDNHPPRSAAPTEMAC